MKTLMLILTLLTAQATFAYQKLEEGSKKIEILVDGHPQVVGEIEYRVLSLKAIAIVTCDNHPEDPVCDSDQIYYERAAYGYIQAKLRAGFSEAVYANGELPEVQWEDVSESSLVPAILVLWKGPSIQGVTGKILEELGNKYL
jgi:hypothetical protein